MLLSMRIKIEQADIFNYVVGNTNYDPIERQIDPEKYEVYDHAIYDHETKVSIPQSETYHNYMEHLRNLKDRVKDMSNHEISKLCVEIQEISPKYINIK
tara:strand:+ start:113 stop:409 length:297 start_codon:yes stop_codon:yes gene_type:complete